VLFVVSIEYQWVLQPGDLSGSIEAQESLPLSWDYFEKFKNEMYKSSFGI